MRSMLLALLVVVPMLMATQPVRADEKDADAPKALLEKAIKARGDEDTLKKMEAGTQKFKGELVIMGMNLEFTGNYAIQRPDCVRTELSINIGGNELQVINVCNKGKGWTSIGGKSKKMTDDELSAAKEEIHVANLTWLTPLRGKEYKLTSLGEMKIDDTPCVGISVERKDYRTVSLYFDKKTHLLVKIEARGKDPMSGAEFNQESFYSDYKKVDGIQTPHKVVVKRDGKDFISSTVTEAKWVEKHDATTFNEP